MWLAPRLSPSVSIINSPSDGAGGGGNQLNLREAGRGAVERQPRMGDRMRLDRDHLAACADMTRQRHRIGADIGADIDEYAAGRRMRPQEIQLLDVVIGIEQGAALGGAGLMIESKRCALVWHIDRTRAEQIDQPRQPGTERAALQPRALRQRDDCCLRGVGRECPEWRRGQDRWRRSRCGRVDASVSSRSPRGKLCGKRRMHSRLCRRLQRYRPPGRRRSLRRAALRHCASGRPCAARAASCSIE